MHLHRSPAWRLRKKLQSSSISVDSLQAAVLVPRQPLAASSTALRRGVTASAQTGMTGTWKMDKVEKNATWRAGTRNTVRNGIVTCGASGWLLPSVLRS